MKGAALMTDEERTSRFCLQMKCKELHGQKLSFTAPHFKCCFLSFHWNLVAFFGTLLHAHSQVRSFFLVCEVKCLRSPSSTVSCRRNGGTQMGPEPFVPAALKHHLWFLEDSFGCLWGEKWEKYVGWSDASSSP